MRKAFINGLCELARQDERICLIVGDLGFSVVEPFAEEFPDRFLNAGVAEQNMIGMATGWSLAENKTVFVYSIANFPTLRCLEQIRNDVCYHRANVKIISVGGGICYGTAGFSHYATEDFAVMRAMPGMVVSAPADDLETYQITRLAVYTPGPFYMRLGRNNESQVHAYPPEIMIGEPICIRQNSGNIVLISTGTIVPEVLKASEKLKRYGISARVVGIPFLKPIDKCKLLDILDGCNSILVVEEHTAFGGLGSAIAEIIAEASLTAKFTRIALPEFINHLGSQADLRRFYGLDSSAICTRAVSHLH